MVKNFKFLLLKNNKKDRIKKKYNLVFKRIMCSFLSNEYKIEICLVVFFDCGFLLKLLLSTLKDLRVELLNF